MVRSFIKKTTFFGMSVMITAASGAFGLISQAVAHAEEAPPAECVISEKLVNSCRPWLGAAVDNYPGITGAHEHEIYAHEERIGRQLDAVHLYHAPGTRPLSDEDRLFANRENTILSVTWQPSTTWAEADGRNASVNALIDDTAEDFLSLGSTKVMLTLHHEPEDQISGGADGCSNSLYIGNAGTPADFRAMWRNVRERFDAKGVQNVVWVLNYMGAQKWDCLVDDMYPGDDLVDWVMWDPYTERETDFSVFVGRFYNVLTNTSDATPDENGVTHDYLSKPWGLAEWGSWHNATPENAYEVYRTAKQAVENNVFPRLKYYSVFDVSATCRIAYDRDGNYDATELQLYKEFANSPVFTNPTQPDPDPEPVPDTEAPSAVGGLSVGDVTETSVALSWNAATDNIAVADYDVYRDGQVLATTIGTAFTDTTVNQGQTYAYEVKARDTSGNVGLSSEAVVVTTPVASGPDTTPPSTPTNLTATPGLRRITLSWSSATDNVGVAGYYVVRDGVRIATLSSSTTTFTDTGLSSGKRYWYKVRAFDAAGNRGATADINARSL